MNCLVCKSGEMSEYVDTYFAQVGSGYVIIENVPCWKCSQCGEVIFSASVLERIEELLEACKKVTSKIFIVDYNRAA